MHDPTVNGHPSLTLPTEEGGQITITVCAECESLRTVLFLDRDRWYCTNCRNTGVAAPTAVRVPRPRRSATHG